MESLNDFLNSRSWKRWQPGDSHLMNRVQWGREELEEVLSVFENDWFAAGKKIEAFKQDFSNYTGVSIFPTNSGSAAIETALLALKEDQRWQPGDVIIHPVTTFATSISSAINLGLNPLYIETKEDTYVADPDQVRLAVKQHPETKGMILPHLMGNIPNLTEIRKSLEGRFLIEDCCDTLGGTFDGKHVGSFGDVAAFSFYASHHISSGGVGGAIGTNNPRLYELIKSIVHWGRDFKPGDREFLKRYTYETKGLDAQMTELQAAFAGAQLKRLPEVVIARANQFQEMTDLLTRGDFFRLPLVDPKAKPSWFAYPLTIKESAPFTRKDFAEYLTSKRVEIRPLMCGNITHQKPFGDRYLSLQGNNFPIGENVEAHSLFIPCWGMPENQREDYYSILNQFLDKQSTNLS